MHRRACGPWILVVLLASSACGRYFATPLKPSDQQRAQMTVNDDGSVTFDRDRLSITLRPMTDAELDRLTSTSEDGSANPYTFGDLKTPGDDFTPSRFTVFRLQVANYQFPKVRLSPLNSRLIAANRREYPALSYGQLYDYYRAHWLGRTGEGRLAFRDRTDVLKRTMYPDAFVFSGTDEEGYVIFPRLHDDVRRVEVHLHDVAVRFDHADEPVETLDLTFRFERGILRGLTPTDATPIH